MWRYPRLFAYFVRFSIGKAMEFRLDFFFRIVMDIIYYAVNIAFFQVVYLQTTLLGGWDRAQVMVFVSGYLCLDALNMTLFSNNMWLLPMYVNKGDLDYYLLRPVSSFFFVSLRDFAANSFVNLMIAGGIMAWAIAHYPHPLHAARIALFVALIVNGTFLYFLLHMLAVIPVFWTHSARGLSALTWSFSRFMERPDRIFTGWVRKILTFVLPYCLMTSYPARLLLEDFDWKVLAHVTLVTAAFFCLVLALWNFALRQYSSASS